MTSQPKKETLIDSLQKRWRALVRFLKKQRGQLPGHINSLPGIIIIALSFTLIVSHNYKPASTVNLYNGIVTTDVLTPQDFKMVDEAATERLREQAAEHVIPIFEYNPKLREQIVANFNQQIELAKEKLPDALQAQFGANGLPIPAVTSLEYSEFLKKFVFTLPRDNIFSQNPNMLVLLVSHQFEPMLVKNLSEALDKSLDGYTYSLDNSEQINGRRISIQNTETGEKSELRSRDLIPLSLAQKRLTDELNSIRSLPAEEREIFLLALKPILGANLKYSATLTNTARTIARQQISPIITQYRKNQIIVRRGDPITPATEEVINKVRNLQENSTYGQRIKQFLGLFVIMLAAVFALRKFSARTTLRQRLGTSRAFSLLCFTLVIQTILIWLGVELSQQVAATFNIVGSAIRYEFLVPYGGAALIMAFLLDAVAAEICALMIGLFTALISGGDLSLIVYAVLSSSAAIFGVERYRQRNSITRAGTIICLSNILAIVTVLLLINQPFTLDVYFYNIIYGISGGLLTAAFVSLMIPINESLFDILTDVKLLELSNMELPLLKDLSIQAPGTQQHSTLVGNLAEAAAEAIDANSLLVRIGCYYHDIGKMMAPEMFIENQGGRPNPHDTMDPKRSASVITGHVRKGILMGQEAGLPEQIVDLIPQHHGTRRLHYFYNKALAQYSQNSGPVNEEHYRYPGPKPQTREAAILMLSDSAEAAARSLDEPTPENIRLIVKRICEDIISDGQLEECELTMREFNTVRESLTETLCSIYHNRIKYPGFNISEDKGEDSISPDIPAPIAQLATKKSLSAAANASNPLTKNVSGSLAKEKEDAKKRSKRAQKS